MTMKLRKCKICGSTISDNVFKEYRTCLKQLPVNGKNVLCKSGKLIGCKNCDNYFVYDNLRRVVGLLDGEYLAEKRKEMLKAAIESVKNVE